MSLYAINHFLINICIFSAKKREAKQSSSADSESDSYADKAKKKKKNKKRYIR